MAEPITVAVRRGEIVEARHTVHAVAVRDGAVVAEAGDGGLVTFMRSAAKPIQALPVVRARPDLDDRELAIASASHLADPSRSARSGRCSPRRPPRRTSSSAAPTASRRARSGTTAPESTPGSWRSAAPAVGLARLPAARPPGAEDDAGRGGGGGGSREEEIPTAIDGCGVVNFALPLERMAYAFSRFGSWTAARVADAMRAHPALIRGPGAPDTVLMESLPGWIAKGGAEGLLCAGRTGSASRSRSRTAPRAPSARRRGVPRPARPSARPTRVGTGREQPIRDRRRIRAD